MPFSIPLETVSCNLCGEKQDFKVLFTAADRQYSNVPPDVNCSVVQCNNCSLIFLNPRVKEEHIGKFYPSSEYYTQEISSGNPGMKKKLKDDMFRMVAKRYFGYPDKKINLESGINPVLLKLMSIIAYRLFSFKYRQIFPYSDGGRHLDFGFGAGSYLERMHDLGWECWGVERDTQGVERMKGKGIRAFTSLWDPTIPKDYFDLLTTYHSMEHLYDPKAVLQRMHEIIKPGGRIYIGVPNFDSFIGRVFRSYWYDLGIPIHPYIYTPSAVGKYMQEAGFSRFDIYYRSLTQGILGSSQLVINTGLGMITGKKEVSMCLRDSMILQLLFLPITKLLDMVSQGDRIEIIGSK